MTSRSPVDPAARGGARVARAAPVEARLARALPVASAVAFAVFAVLFALTGAPIRIGPWDVNAWWGLVPAAAFGALAWKRATRGRSPRA